MNNLFHICFNLICLTPYIIVKVNSVLELLKGCLMYTLLYSLWGCCTEKIAGGLCLPSTCEIISLLRIHVPGGCWKEVNKTAAGRKEGREEIKCFAEGPGYLAYCLSRTCFCIYLQETHGGVNTARDSC